MVNFILSTDKTLERRQGMINTFDYRKLRGRIVEMYGTQNEFFEHLNISKTALSKKMQNKSGFSQDDVVEWCNLLDIDLKDVGSFFYALKV